MKLKTRKSIAPSAAPRCIVKGIMTAMIITVLGAWGMSGLIIKELLRETAIGYCAMAILLFASMAAGLISVRSAERKKALIAAFAGMGYALILLLLNAVLYRGGYEGIGVTLVLILGGCSCGMFLGMERKKVRHSTKRKRKSR